MATITVVFPEPDPMTGDGIPMVFPYETHVWGDELIIWQVLSLNSSLSQVKIQFSSGVGLFPGGTDVATAKPTYHGYDPGKAGSKWGDALIIGVNARKSATEDKYSVIGQVGSSDVKEWTVDPKIITDGP